MKYSKRFNKTESGFSLLELILTLLIAGIIAGVGVPSFNSALGNPRMLTANDDLIMSLNLVKSEVLKRVSYVTVCRSSNGASCMVGVSTWSGGRIAGSAGSFLTRDFIPGKYQ